MLNKCIGDKVCEIFVFCLGLFELKFKFDWNVFRLILIIILELK